MWILVFGFLAAALPSVLYSLRLVIRYRLTECEIQILLFGFIPMLRIKLADVWEVRQARFEDNALYITECIWTANLSNRFRGQVLIRRRHGLRRNVFITPKDPAEFVTRCNRILEANAADHPQ